MTCSINIVRKVKPECECKYIGDEEEELDVEFLLTNLYEKVGELRRRIEVLENER